STTRARINMTSRRGIRRVLKPVIEKKRRDRINQRLDELRTLLLSNTADTRLQNPKLEKAEILDLTVEYIRRKTDGGTPHQGKDLLHTDNIRIEFTPPAPRGLAPRRRRAGTRARPGAPPAAGRWAPSALRRRATLPPPWGPSEAAQIPSPTAPSCSTGTPQRSRSTTLTPHPRTPSRPPPSPCFSSSSPAFSASPPYLTVPCHFVFPPSLSPPSSSDCSSPPGVPAGLPGSPTPLRPAPPCPPRTLRRTLFQNQSSAVWRPWS
uniref:BHLH domain-containing protein n=1 Tax=Denticeps clupeoides TaxID=299321 RepID=A0AAY4BFG9_9TELE